MANIIFTISNKHTNDKAELLVRFYASRAVDLRAHTRLYVPFKYWDNKLQRMAIPRRNITEEVIAATESQSQIDEIRTFILEKFMQQPDERQLTKDWLEHTIDDFHEIDHDEKRTPIYDIIDQYVVARNLAWRTQRQYGVLKRMLRRFSTEVRPMDAGHIETSDIGDFELFLRREKVPTKNIPDRLVERCQNTINSKLRRFRALCNYAVEIGMADSNPFDNFTIPSDVYGTPTWLTIDERNAIYNTHFDNPSMERQKDIFVFQCFIGCRVSDLLSFTTENVTDDGFIQYIQQKMRKMNPETIRVPLTETAKEIIAKYAGQPDGRLLPFISQVKYNNAIKRVLTAAGITRVVLVQNKYTYENEPRRICDIAASHLARRTFMANMFRQTRSERITSAFTGHAEHSIAFSRYTEIDDEMKREIIAGIDTRTQCPE